MTPHCPYCGQLLPPTPSQVCTSCGRELPIFVTPQPRELARFRDTVLQVTPRTWAIPTIVVVNVLVFVVMILSGANPMNPQVFAVLDWGANFGPLTLNGQWWRIVTCMFLHFGIIHIGFNMYVLWQIGNLVERLVGSIGLLALYLTSGVAASIASLWWNPTAVSAGASGAVFGVCGALLGFISLRRDTIPREVVVGLRSSLITFVIYNVVIGMVVPFIDMAAHLGGFIYGVVCGMVLSQPVSLEMVGRRWVRNMALLVASAALLPVAFHFLPPAPRDHDLLEQRIWVLDYEASVALQELSRKSAANAIDDDVMPASLQAEVLPKWREALDESQKLIEMTGGEPTERQQAIEDYLTARVRGLEALIETAKNGDPEKHLEYANLWRDIAERQEELRKRDRE